MFTFQEDNLLYWIIGLSSLVLLPWWLIKLWQSLHTIFSAPTPPPPPTYHIKKVDQTVSFWFRGPFLFTVGGIITFLGFLLTIIFRNPQFLYLIILGSIFLSCLFFYTYFIVFSDQDRSIFANKMPENLQVYTHPDWLFQHKFFFGFGLINILAGVIAGYLLDDIYYVLFSIYGCVFLLHLWSFAQLNILTITDQTLNFHTGLPASGILTIPIHTITSVVQSQPFLQRLLRVYTVHITDNTGAKLTLHTRLPHLLTTTLKPFPK